jgi:hypothetical protein
LGPLAEVGKFWNQDIEDTSTDKKKGEVVTSLSHS